MFYVYRFLNKENIVIYVGRTGNIKSRIRSQHFNGNGHLPIECYNQTETILYSECESKSDSAIKEIYFINKYMPKYNDTWKEGASLECSFPSIRWRILSFDKERSYLKSLIKQVNGLPSYPAKILDFRNKTCIQQIFGTLFSGDRDLDYDFSIKLIGDYEEQFNLSENTINCIKIEGEIYFYVHSIDLAFDKFNSDIDSLRLIRLVKKGVIKEGDLYKFDDSKYMEKYYHESEYTSFRNYGGKNGIMKISKTMVKVANIDAAIIYINDWKIRIPELSEKADKMIKVIEALRKCNKSYSA